MFFGGRTAQGARVLENAHGNSFLPMMGVFRPSRQKKMARETGLEPATSTVTGWYSNQLSYSPAL